MSRVQYNSKRIIPAPFVTISKTYSKTGDGKIVGKIYNITVTGTIVAFKGSPTSSGTWWEIGGYPPDEVIDDTSRLSAIERKQEALRNLFSDEGKSFEIQALDATTPMKCNPRVVSIDFPEGSWYNTSPYTIVLEADELYPEQEDLFDLGTSSGNIYIADAQESWSLDTDEQPEGYGKELDRTYRITHNISAVGKRFYDETGTLVKEAWEQAKDYVSARLGFDSSIMLSSGINNLPDYYSGFNHVISSNTDEDGGSFAAIESWIIASGSALEDFSLEVNSSTTEALVTVNLRGEITGLNDGTNTKWDNALTKFGVASGVAFSRAQTFGGVSNLNIVPKSVAIGKNPVTGTINYSFEYDNRPMNLISGAISEVILVNDNLRGDMFASIFVLGRDSGPVLQDLNASTDASRSLTIDLVVPIPTITGRSFADIQQLLNNEKPSSNPTFSGDIANVIAAVNPANNGFTQVFSNKPQEQWDFKRGVWSWNQEWVYE